MRVRIYFFWPDRLGSLNLTTYDVPARSPELGVRRWMNSEQQYDDFDARQVHGQLCQTYTYIASITNNTFIASICSFDQSWAII